MPITPARLAEIRHRLAAAEARCDAGMRAQEVSEVVDSLVDIFQVAHDGIPALLEEVERLWGAPPPTAPAFERRSPAA